MASFTSTSIFFFTISLSIYIISCGTVVEDLNNLKPPPDFNKTITNNCLNNPSLRYCNFMPIDLPEIFKFTIVASHLCNISKNPNCVETFPKINLRSSPKIAPLYLSFEFFWKYCPLTIMSIDLANNSLKGDFPNDIFHCSQILSLDVSLNKLSGDFPIKSFSQLTNLTFLNLSYNQFSEAQISDTQIFKRFNSSSFLDSGLLPDHEKFRIKAVFFLLGFPIIIIIMVIFLCWLCFRRPDFLPRMFQRKHEFTTSILKAATDGFSKKNLVSQGEEIGVYKGLFRDGTEVRIEVYWDNMCHEKRKTFVDECKILVQLHHQNLVRVMGWCVSRNLRAIIIEWMDGQSIRMWLLTCAPSWEHRVEVLMGVVEAMYYLNEEWPQVGCDLDTSSILLSDDQKPLITRFKVVDQDNNKRGVYKFGLLILEMVSNRRPKDEFARGEAGFIEWVKMHYPGDLQNLIDERMENRPGFKFDQAKEAIILGLICTDLSSGRRPSLEHISDMVSVLYHSCIVSAHPNHMRWHGDREGRRCMQSR